MRRDIPALLLTLLLSRHRPPQPTFGLSARPSAVSRLGARCAELRQKVRGFDARPVRHGWSMKNLGGLGSSGSSRPPHQRARFQASDAQQEPFVKRGPADMSWLRSICEKECNSSRARGVAVRFHGFGSYLTGRGSLSELTKDIFSGRKTRRVPRLPDAVKLVRDLFIFTQVELFRSFFVAPHEARSLTKSSSVSCRLRHHVQKAPQRRAVACGKSVGRRGADFDAVRAAAAGHSRVRGGLRVWKGAARCCGDGLA